MRCLAMPADDGGGDLVAERHHQQRRVIGELADAVDDAAPHLLRGLRVVEEGDVLRPRQADHQPEAGVGGGIEDVGPGTV